MSDDLAFSEIIEKLDTINEKVDKLIKKMNSLEHKSLSNDKVSLWLKTIKET